MSGKPDALPYTYPPAGLPPPETTCQHGNLSRDDIEMGKQNERCTHELGVYIGNMYGRSSTENASDVSTQVGKENSGKGGNRYLNSVTKDKEDDAEPKTSNSERC